MGAAVTGALTLCGVWTPLAPTPAWSYFWPGCADYGLLFCLVTAICDMTLHGTFLVFERVLSRLMS